MKTITSKSLSRWWHDVLRYYSPDEIVRFILTNRIILERKIHRMDNNSYLYRLIHHIFYIITFTAGLADTILSYIRDLLLKLPGIKIIIGAANGLKNHLNIRGIIEFVQTKIYSLKRHPHSDEEFRAAEEILEFISRQGHDCMTAIPEAIGKFNSRKHQLMQHKYFQEFSKSFAEKLLAINFNFNRNIFPVLPDSALWHKIFLFLEFLVLKDLVLVNSDGSTVSLKNSGKQEIASSDVARTLRQLEELKISGKRIFFTGHHEGYIGPYFVRSAIRRLGFNSLTQNSNTVAGPRMFSNIILRNGAANVGNLFLAVPSQKTTVISTKGLAGELKKTAKRTQILIKMPEPMLKIIEQTDFDQFMKIFVHNTDSMDSVFTDLSPGEISEVEYFIIQNSFSESMKGLGADDYELFKKIMREPFLIFPEGSRSYIDPDGAVVMKYVNPKYFETYMRVGDYVAPISVVGGSDIASGVKLKPGKLGFSMGEPFVITEEMMKTPEEWGLKIMKDIASLPNLKEVRFKEEIQFKNRG